MIPVWLAVYMCIGLTLAFAATFAGEVSPGWRPANRVVFWFGIIIAVLGFAFAWPAMIVIGRMIRK